MPDIKHINFDANASHGLLPEVEQGLLELGLNFLNPSSIHQGGQRAKALVENARSQVSQLLGLASDDKLIFTSGATESNNATIMGLGLEALGRNYRGDFALSSAVEHPSVLEPLKRLSNFGLGVTLITPEQGFNWTPQTFCDQCSNSTILASIMLANNESGQVLSVSEITAALKSRFPKILVLCDAVQALGKLDFSFPELGVDFLSISGHKIGALTGVGALVIGRDVPWSSLMLGGPQELHMRAGTENVLGIVSFGLACEVVQRTLEARITKLRNQTEWLKVGLLTAIPGSALNFDMGLPNTLSLRIPGILADDLVVALDLEQVFISSGAACASGKPEPSHVLLAMGLSSEQARETVRISLPFTLSQIQLEQALSSFVACIKRMRLCEV